MKILVIQKKLMGDILICSVVFRLLRETFPQAQLHYLVGKNYAQVIEHNPFIDKIIFFDDKLKNTIGKVRKEKYDAVIDTYSKLETALISLLSGAKIRTGYYKSYTQFFYTHPVRRRREAQSPYMTTTIEHRLQLLEPLGIDYQITTPEIFITDEEKNQAKTLLASLGLTTENHHLVMLSTFGSTKEKTYPIAYMAEIVNWIVSHRQVKILCNYLPHQREDFEAFYATLSPEIQANVVKDFDTRNLREYMAVLECCRALIGNEGGSTNISKAMKVPTFTIFAPHVGKHGWNWADDGIKNVSVHVNDFLPEAKTYEAFRPQLFRDKLLQFLDRI